jgi:hypothetical protein
MVWSKKHCPIRCRALLEASRKAEMQTDIDADAMPIDIVDDST